MMKGYSAQNFDKIYIFILSNVVIIVLLQLSITNSLIELSITARL